MSVAAVAALPALDEEFLEAVLALPLDRILAQGTDAASPAPAPAMRAAAEAALTAWEAAPNAEAFWSQLTPGSLLFPLPAAATAAGIALEAEEGHLLLTLPGHAAPLMLRPTPPAGRGEAAELVSHSDFPFGWDPDLVVAKVWPAPRRAPCPSAARRARESDNAARPPSPPGGEEEGEPPAQAQLAGRALGSPCARPGRTGKIHSPGPQTVGRR
jgi:hypothetical protein